MRHIYGHEPYFVLRIVSHHESWDEIRPGDLVEYTSDETNHVVVVVRKTDECIFVTESGLSNKTRWGGQYFRWWLEEQPEYILFTRYPQ